LSGTTHEGCQPCPPIPTASGRELTLLGEKKAHHFVSQRGVLVKGISRTDVGASALKTSDGSPPRLGARPAWREARDPVVVQRPPPPFEPLPLPLPLPLPVVPLPLPLPVVPLPLPLPVVPLPLPLPVVPLPLPLPVVPLPLPVVPLPLPVVPLPLPVMLLVPAIPLPELP
jgi:hypothetical protein